MQMVFHLLEIRITHIKQKEKYMNILLYM